MYTYILLKFPDARRQDTFFRAVRTWCYYRDEFASKTSVPRQLVGCCLYGELCETRFVQKVTVCLFTQRKHAFLGYCELCRVCETLLFVEKAVVERERIKDLPIKKNFNVFFTYTLSNRYLCVGLQKKIQ